jgi:hypothetical protein
MYEQLIAPNTNDPLPSIPRFNEKVVVKHSLRPFNTKCKFCEALHFEGEKIQLKGKSFYFKICCWNGSFKLPSTNRPYPLWLEKALTNPNDFFYDQLHSYIRRYNASISFAFMKTNYKRPGGKGPDVVIMGGGVHHLLPSELNSLNLRDRQLLFLRR